MLFNTLNYAAFLIVAVIIYYILPKQVCYFWLLGASYFFYMQWNAKYALLMLTSTLITYVGALVIEWIRQKEGENSKKKCRFCLTLAILINLAILVFFKYFNFMLQNVDKLLAAFGSGATLDFGVDVLLPVGISFYTLQALGYLIDVYREDIKAERNVFRYALFVSFFPQLVAGPIERSKNLMEQLRDKHAFDYENFRRGFYFFAYGLFLKMVIADRAAIVVDTVFADPYTYRGLYIVFATFLFTIQLYCDFYGYSLMARGSALFFGISLMSNFEAPFFSKSINEFWRRWHISLSSWFKDYLYIPLGGSRVGKARSEFNRFIVFIISGLWHGASWNFVLWGFLHAVYQLIGNCYRLLMKQFFGFVDDGKRFSTRARKMLVTFALVVFALMFFRASGANDTVTMIKQLGYFESIKFFELGVDGLGMFYLFLSIAVLFVVDYFKYNGVNVMEALLAQEGWFRYAVFLFLFLSTLIFGCYGTVYDAKQFIYFQF